MSPKFLRYKSDSDYWGWNTTQMFLLFQDMQDEMLENGWRDGPVYVLEILLYDPNEYYGTNEPRLEMLYDPEYEELEDEILVAEMPEEITQRYWGVKRVVCKVELLVDVNNENAYDKIFGVFKYLKTK